MISKYDPQKDGPLDRFIKLTDTAKILDYAHYDSVVKLIENGQLTDYLLPHVLRRRVLESEVIKLKEFKKIQTAMRAWRKDHGDDLPSIKGIFPELLKTDLPPFNN